MAQYAWPVSDVSWTWQAGTPVDTAGNRYQNLDETNPVDTDYNYSANNPNGSGSEFGLGAVTDPGVGSGHNIWVRLCKVRDGTPNGTGATVNATVTLRQGAATIATIVPGSPIGGSWASWTYTLTAAEANAITDYGNLSVLVEFTGGGGSPSNRRGGALSWIQWLVPSPGASGSGTGIYEATRSSASGNGGEWFSGAGTGLVTDVASGTGSGSVVAPTVSGSGTGVWAGKVGSGSGGEVFTGAGTTAWMVSIGSGTAAEWFSGSGSGVWAQVVGSGSGAESVSGVGTGVWTAALGSGVAGETFTGSGVAVWADWTATGTGTTGAGVTGSGVGLWSATLGIGDGGERFAASGVGTWDGVLGAGTGVVATTITGSGTAVWYAGVGTGTGLQWFRGVGTGIYADWLGTGTGAVLEDIVGFGTGTWAGWMGTGSGTAIMWDVSGAGTGKWGIQVEVADRLGIRRTLHRGLR